MSFTPNGSTAPPMVVQPSDLTFEIEGVQDSLGQNGMFDKIAEIYQTNVRREVNATITKFKCAYFKKNHLRFFLL